jgi:hypothetical protein
MKGKGSKNIGQVGESKRVVAGKEPRASGTLPVFHCLTSMIIGVSVLYKCVQLYIGILYTFHPVF